MGRGVWRDGSLVSSGRDTEGLLGLVVLIP